MWGRPVRNFIATRPALFFAFVAGLGPAPTRCRLRPGCLGAARADPAARLSLFFHAKQCAVFRPRLRSLHGLGLELRSRAFDASPWGVGFLGALSRLICSAGQGARLEGGSCPARSSLCPTGRFPAFAGRFLFGLSVTRGDWFWPKVMGAWASLALSITWSDNAS